MKILKSNRIAVSPVIATIILIRIAVIGNSITGVFTQALNKWQIGAYPTVELVKFTGFDARDAKDIEVHMLQLQSHPLLQLFMMMV